MVVLVGMTTRVSVVGAVCVVVIGAPGVSGWPPGRVTWRRPSSARLAGRWHPDGRSPGFAASPLQAAQPRDSSPHGGRGGVPTVEAMEIWVLGTLEVSHDGRAVEVRGLAAAPPARAARAHAGSGGRQPTGSSTACGARSRQRAAPATLHSHVARLRRDLRAPDVVRTGRHGYLLDVAAGRRRRARVRARGRRRAAPRCSRDATTRRAPLGRGAGPLARDAVRRVRRLSDPRGRGRAAGRAAAGRPGAPDLGRPRTPRASRRPSPSSRRWCAGTRCASPSGRCSCARSTAPDGRATRSRPTSGPARRSPTSSGVDPGPQLQELERLILAQDPSLEMPGMSTFLPARPVGAPTLSPWHSSRGPHLLETLTGLHDDALAGSGRLVLVHGEAGVGKSALVRAWSAAAASAVRVLWGACDPLSSPRPLGPLVDVAPRPRRRGSASCCAPASATASSRRRSTASPTAGPTVLVIEDLHWADMSTLDLLRFLARRLEGTAHPRRRHLPRRAPARRRTRCA